MLGVLHTATDHNFPTPFPSPPAMKAFGIQRSQIDVPLLLAFPAVQEERQRGKDRNENEVESTSNANEDMPVEKILEAELAVEPKTETYIEANMGLTPNSVRRQPRLFSVKACRGDFLEPGWARL